jgi:hypothetical protein
MKLTPLFFIALAVPTLTGCATAVPSMAPVGLTDQQEVDREGALVNHVKCELKQALQRIYYEEAQQPPHENPPGYINNTDWLKTWGASVSLKFQVDELATASPNLAYTKALHNVVSVFPAGGNVTTARSDSLAVGASVTSHVTRTETIGFYYKFADLDQEVKAQADAMAKQAGATAAGDIAGAEQTARDLALARIRDKPCESSGNILVYGDLKIHDFMRSKVSLARVAGVIEAQGKKPPFTTFTYEVQFILMGSGSATPTWKLVPVAMNPTAPFLNASRTKLHDLIVTMGPDEDGQPSPEAQNQHQAQLIGQAVADALRN